jgi:hypothetical protein
MKEYRVLVQFRSATTNCVRTMWLTVNAENIVEACKEIHGFTTLDVVEA